MARLLAIRCRRRVVERLRQEEHERAAKADFTGQRDLAAQQPRDLAADGEPEPRPAVLAAGRAVRLLKRFEDDAVLFARDADARVADAEGDHARRLVEGLGVAAPAAGGDVDRQI